MDPHRSLSNRCSSDKWTISLQLRGTVPDMELLFSRSISNEVRLEKKSNREPFKAFRPKSKNFKCFRPEKSLLDSFSNLFSTRSSLSSAVKSEMPLGIVP
mmetsp:Transcript_9375/g.16792  ORF Transcript_9375/g.16792 Transcript_9375/m.16792 type:complete len:100 (+) Transcript_9375:133-432(+)